MDHSKFENNYEILTIAFENHSMNSMDITYYTYYYEIHYVLRNIKDHIISINHIMNKRSF